MAEKNTTTVKKTPPKNATKKATKGDSYVCGICGLSVTVDEVCNCAEVCDIVCCGEPMKASAKKAK